MTNNNKINLKINDWVNHLNNQISMFETTKHRLLAWLGSIIITMFFLTWLLLNLVSEKNLDNKQIIIIILIAIDSYIMLQLLVLRLGLGYKTLARFLFGIYEGIESSSTNNVLEYMNKNKSSFILHTAAELFSFILVTLAFIYVSTHWDYKYKIIIDVIILMRIIYITTIIIIVTYFTLKLNEIISNFDKNKPVYRGFDSGFQFARTMIPFIIAYTFQIAVITFLLWIEIDILDNLQNIWKILLILLAIICLYFCSIGIYIMLKINSKKIIYSDFVDKILLGEIYNQEEIKYIYKRIKKYVNNQNFIILQLDDIIQENTIKD